MLWKDTSFYWWIRTEYNSINTCWQSSNLVKVIKFCLSLCSHSQLSSHPYRTENDPTSLSLSLSGQWWWFRHQLIDSVGFLRKYHTHDDKKLLLFFRAFVQCVWGWIECDSLTLLDNPSHTHTHYVIATLDYTHRKAPTDKCVWHNGLIHFGKLFSSRTQSQRVTPAFSAVHLELIRQLLTFITCVCKIETKAADEGTRHYPSNTHTHTQHILCFVSIVIVSTWVSAF